MYLVYVIKNSKGQTYIGQTFDIQKRLARHNSILPSKISSFTKNKGPWHVVYTEGFNTRREAKQREGYLKSSVGRRFLKSILAQR